MDFYDRVGCMAMGSRLRRLGDRMADDSAQIYALYGVDLQPRWFPVIYLVYERGEESIKSIAEEIGHTHASVSQIVTEMVRGGYACLKKRKADGRKTFVALTTKGKNALNKFQEAYVDIRKSVEEMQTEMGAD